MKNENDKNLPKWDKTQVQAQKSINKRMAIRTALMILIVAIVIIVAIIVWVASNNKNATPQAPSPNATTAQIQKYANHKFSDNNASTIDTISVAKNTNILMVKVNNVDVSSNNSASNSFSQLTDEMQSLGSYDLAKNGIIFYGNDPYETNSGKTSNKVSFALYFTQDNIQSLNSNYSDYVGSGNYTNLFKNADGYYLYQPFQDNNRKLNKISSTKSINKITNSLNIN
ncbi:hypothetical protein [Companilactobacillus sp.]|uniref:hypothetical protein n=1 Tax=Companilactobacillus sp. TaxID=2767905 RepID=UPI0026371CA2|nr:hypothetical protein [Companilactobacillus sp.]